MALLAPWIAPYGLHEQVGPPFGPPSPAHPLGLDDGGIDMVTLLMWGTRISLLVGFAATVVSILIGGTVGLTAGYFGGKVDTVLMRITDYFIVIPDVPLMIVVAAIWGPSIGHIIIVIGILLWTGTARVLRAQVKSVRERVYVQRSRALGASHWRIVGRHVLPQVAPLLIANTVLTVAVAIFDETALSFLGLGDPSAISLGKVIENAFERAAISSGRLVGDRPAGHPRRADHPQLQPDRRRARGLPQSAPARRAPRRADVPAPAARRPLPGGAVTPLLQIEDLHVWFDIEDAPGAPRRAGREHVARRRANGSASSASRAAERRPPRWRCSGCSRRRRASPGKVLLEGKDLLADGEDSVRPHRWVDIAIVFQGAMNALNPVRTIGSQIVEALELHGRATGSAARAQSVDLLESVGIPGSRAERFPHELSGGMRQRAAIAMALSCNPKVLIADEPTTALDVMVQAQILELLDSLCRDFGLALILVTHDLPVVAQLCSARRRHVRGRDRRERPRGRPVPRAAASVHAAPVRRDARPRDAKVGGIASIPGAPPRLDRPLTGCPFRERCDSSFEPCASERPLLQTSSGPSTRRPATSTTGRRRRHERAARDRGPRRPLSVAARALRIARAARGAVGARGRRRHADAGRGRARRARRRVRAAARRRLRRPCSGSSIPSPAPFATRAGTSPRSARASSARSGARSRSSTRIPYESLDPRLRVRDAIEEPLLIHRIGGSKEARLDRVREALARVELAPPELFLDRYPHELSGGQRQRVAIAAALVLEPRLLVADEPVSMLDVSVRAGVLKLLDGLRKSGLTVLMITHDLSTAALFADRIAVMYLGRIVELGPAGRGRSEPAASVHEGAPVGRARRRPARAEAAPDPARRDPGCGPDSERLPLPSPLPGRDRRVQLA